MEDDDDDDEDEDEQRIMEGLSPTDALLMPLFAGTALASLYFLLKWMKDPALLNKILNAYFAVFGVFSVSRLVTDLLDIGHSILYPRRHVVGRALYHIDGEAAKAAPVAGDVKDKQPLVTPLPGFLSKIPLSEGARNLLWADRAMPGNKWTLKLYMHRVFSGKFKIGPHGMVGVLTGLVTVAYFNLVDKPWYLTNLLGFGFSYGALQLMSPTTFATGSLILGALFFYDIYFVFFTPMMVTVAKSLDVPIKLMFPRPAAADDPTSVPSHAMLGLGDVVLPGIMIGLALRFDLYLFYLRRQTCRPAAAGEGQEIVEKPEYYSLTGRWTDYFWTHSLTGRPLWVSTKTNPETEAPFTFPKTYFNAGLVGYVLGLLATLSVMMIWNHAQPALLYLVPGVLGSIWLTALVRGEINLMWNYTEEIEDEEQAETSNTSDPKSPLPKNESSAGQASQKKRASSRKSDKEIFSLSIEAPWQLKKLSDDDGYDDKPKTTSAKDASQNIDTKQNNWVASTTTAVERVDAEPAGKRLRVK
ncbi:intramembrane protease 2 [Bipolaris maydis]|nr:signal peptide peptidase-domain-containing protein [Bipolaris maydis]KAJ5063377.1 intramembrane protease 2 [Bipolaris maydis]KAJ6199640.1 intramembrane protease 2 [Bipolaris maydis]KAJ6272768.1 signal peptide peptidase-domain-containing protein [Bipolaris maydis]